MMQAEREAVRPEGPFLMTNGAAAGAGGASIGLRPAATVEVDGVALNVRVKALDAEGRIALLGAHDLTVGRSVTVSLAAGLTFKAIVQEQRSDRAVVAPVPQQRVRARRQPVNRTGCRLVLACGTEANCDVVDVSATGLFVRTDAPLAIGETVMIGRTTGQVVRADGDGFGLAIVPSATAPTERPRLRAI